MDLEKYRKQAEDFISEADKEYYLHFSGQKDEYNLTGIYEKHKDLFTKEAIEEIKHLREKVSGEEKKRLDYLFHFCTKEYFGQQIKEIKQEIA